MMTKNIVPKYITTFQKKCSRSLFSSNNGLNNFIEATFENG